MYTNTHYVYVGHCIRESDVIMYVVVFTTDYLCMVADSDFTQTVQKISEKAEELSQQSTFTDTSPQYYELYKLTLQLLKP